MSLPVRISLAAAIALGLGVCSNSAWKATPEYIAGQPTDWTRAAWWSTPIERNRVLRPSPDSLKSVFFLDDGQRGWAAGDSGTILSTTDGGLRWTPRTSDTNETLRSVYFAKDGQRGWAVGEHGTILATTDGGWRWAPQISGSSDELTSVQFTSDGQRGWAVGPRDTVLGTIDGGRRWTPQSSGTNVPLLSEYFAADGQRGWAVGHGTILATTDGGQRWTPQDNRTTEVLASVHFTSDGRRGWTAGGDGTILATTDGGQRWTLQTSGTNEALRLVYFAADGLRGWAVGDRGTILATTDGGRRWMPQTSGTTESLNSVHFTASGQRGWAVGADGVILATANGGIRWTPQTSGSNARLRSVHLVADGQRGWAVGYGGAILVTTNGGQRWTAQASGTDEDLTSVRVAADGQRGWAVGERGTILATSNGGQSWTAQTGGTNLNLESVYFTADGRRGWAVGDAILATTDGGQHWTAQMKAAILATVYFAADGQRGWSMGIAGLILLTKNGGQEWTFVKTTGTDYGLSSVYFASDSQRGWAVGGNGAIVATTDGGQHWTPQSSGTEAFLKSVHFAGDGQHGWAAGEGGTMLTTTNGGQQWALQTSGTSENLASVDFAADGQRGWAVGDGGTILATTDGGQHWTQPFRYRQFPNALYLASLAVGLLCLVGLSHQPKPAPRESINDTPIGDSPAARLKADRLGAQRLVKTLYRFLSNPNTIPPLTLSIEAPWGKGKSSVLKMLQSLLEEHGTPTVWFNAWHYQKEDPLLAFLMEAIQKQAVPPLFSWRTPWFRMKLVSYRLWQRQGWVPLAVAIGIGWLWAARPEFIKPILDALPAWAQRFAPPAGFVAAALWSYGKLLRAFGTSPDDLLKEANQAFRLPSLRGKTDVRTDFQEELEDVLAALAPKRLVIILDDLDRCSPAQTVAVMESINYLSSIEGCFFVLGMDRDKVATAVGLQLGDAAIEERRRMDPVHPPETDVQKAKVRGEYATNYLKKIINMTVGVREPTPEEVRRYLSEPAWTDSREALKRILQRAAVLLGLLALVGVVWLMNREAPTMAPAEVAAVAPQPVPGGPITPPPVDGGKRPTETPPPLRGQTAPAPPKPDLTYMNWIFVGLSTALLLVIGRMLLRVRSGDAEDSEAFQKALSAFTPVIAHRYPSPREQKRFLNGLRLLASSAWEPDKSFFEWTAVLLGLFRKSFKESRERGVGPIRAANSAWCERGHLLERLGILRLEQAKKRESNPGLEACLVYLAVEGEKATKEWLEALSNYERAQLRTPDEEDRSFYEHACLGLGLDPWTLEPVRNENGGTGIPATAGAP